MKIVVVVWVSENAKVNDKDISVVRTNADVYRAINEKAKKTESTIIRNCCHTLLLMHNDSNNDVKLFFNGSTKYVGMRKLREPEYGGEKVAVHFIIIIITIN